MKFCYSPNTRANSWRTEDEQRKISNTDGKKILPPTSSKDTGIWNTMHEPSAFSQYAKFLEWRDFSLILCSFSYGTFLPFAITQFLCNLPDIYKHSTIIKVILNFGLLTQEDITSSIKLLSSVLMYLLKTHQKLIKMQICLSLIWQM